MSNGRSRGPFRCPFVKWVWQMGPLGQTGKVITQVIGALRRRIRFRSSQC
ncbi:hypothetical protein C725_0481 [Pacificimonas flava]|uniref:Uncharacterized protein n=1 Tax=Pacificimonas flava TaxID=1234595 RepID=M2TRX8_9SPHN|nr:hypothetical protein C725_0481 [Pacificimonas flava]